MIKSPFFDNFINFHQFQGNTNDCGPYSASIIISAINNRVLQGKSLSKYLDNYPARLKFPFFLRIPGWATFPWGITSILKQYGIHSHWQIFTSESHLINILSQNIAIVLTGTWCPLISHYRILVAYDSSVGWGFVDPAVPKNIVVWQKDADFKKTWNTMGRSVIIIDPKK